MKKLPQRIWLDADSCWTEKPQGEGYTEYIRKDIVKQGKKKMLEKVFEWIDEHIYDRKYEIRDNEGIWVDTDELLADLKKTMGL